VIYKAKFHSLDIKNEWNFVKQEKKRELLALNQDNHVRDGVFDLFLRMKIQSGNM